MATYRVTAPDGKVYDVTPPEGTNPTEDEILAQVQAQVAAPSATPAEKPGVGSLLLQSVKNRASEALAVPARVAGAVRDFAADPSIPNPLDLMPKPSPSLALPVAIPGGGTVVTRLGAFAAGRMMEEPSTSPMENLKTAARGVVGDLMGDQPLDQKIASVALSPAALEVAIPAGGKLLRSWPGAKGRIAAQDAARVGETLEDITSGTVKARTAAEMRAASAPTREALGAEKLAANKAISEKVGLIEVPSISRVVNVPGHGYTVTKPGAALVDVPGHTYTDRGRAYDPEMQRWVGTERPVAVPGHTANVETTRPEAVSISGHSYREPMTFQEANDALSEIGAKAFSKNPLDRTFQGIDQRRLYGHVYKEITSALGKADESGAALALFEKAQDKYKIGLEVAKLLERKSLYRATPSGPEFDIVSLQKLLADPRAEAVLRKKLGDANFEALSSTATRGGPPGAVDRPAWGTGSAGDAVRMLLEMKGGTGALIGAVPKTLLPNVAARYAGRAPYVASPTTRTVADLVGQSLVRVGPEARELAR